MAQQLALDTVVQVAQTLGISQTHPGLILCQGWILKKRRKKMQGMPSSRAALPGANCFLLGFARRYFTLTSDGSLSYALQPGGPPRDEISLIQASISSSGRRRDIHIDSGRSTFHVKCLSKKDFEVWMAAFRCHTLFCDGNSV